MGIETTGSNTIIADPDDSESWIEAFERLENKNLYLKQVEKGLSWVKSFLGNKGNEKQLSDIEEIIGRN